MDSNCINHEIQFIETAPCHGSIVASDGDSRCSHSKTLKFSSRYAPCCDDVHISRQKIKQNRRSTFIRKKNRRASLSCSGYFVLITLSLTVLTKTQAFTTPHRYTESFSFMVRSKLITQFSTTTPSEEVIIAVKPETRSKKRRKSSKRRQPSKKGASGGADGSIPDDIESYLDFLDTSFSNGVPPKPTTRISNRPKGRPESVPGAMSRQSMRELESVSPTQSSYSASDMESKDDFGSEISPIVQKRRGRGRPRKISLVNDDASKNMPIVKSRKEKTAAGSINSNYNSTALINESQILKESRKVKNLPPSRNKDDAGTESETTGMMEKGDVPRNLSKYYRTELLSAHEEYELGMKIQFMMKSEDVHEGLQQKLSRLPTISEWAAACGFVVKDDSPINFEDVDYIRPLSAIDKDDQDPYMFVGNGLVNASGPGRGKGRVKSPPPTFLKDFYYDVESEFEDVNGKRVKKKITPNLKPINRGTPQNFLDMMMEGKDAKQRMIQCNMRLVVSISKRYGHVGVNVADLIQEGSIGLSRAAEKFEPMMGYKFSTYASWWIQQAVFRAIAYQSRTIRLPVHVHNHLNRVRRVRLELQREKGRAPTNEEMAGELQMTVEKYNKMLRLSRKAISLDIAKYQNNPKDVGQESDTSIGDTIDAADVIKDENTPEQSVNRVLFRDDLKEMLKILGEDERAVIDARYGLSNGLTQTVTTVAAKMGQTKAWVRSAECCALRKLRRPWYEKRLWEHQNTMNG